MALITTAEVKTHHGYDASLTDKDAMIAAQIPLVESLVQSYCRRSFEIVTVTDKFLDISEPTEKLYLRFYPIDTVTKLEVLGQSLTLDTDYIIKKERGIIKKKDQTTAFASINFVEAFPAGDNEVEITYTSSETLPGGVKLVLLEFVGILAGIKKKHIILETGEEEVISVETIPKEFRRTLNLYKRHFVETND